MKLQIASPGHGCTGNQKRETESLLKAAKNNAIRTNNVKDERDKTKENSKFRPERWNTLYVNSANWLRRSTIASMIV